MVTPGSTEESSLNSRSSSSAAGGLIYSVLAQKGRLKTAPSALPQNLLPLLGRGLSISSLPRSRSLEHQNGGLLSRVKPPASAAVSGRGSGPSEPPVADTHSQLPHEQTHSPEQDTESPTEATMLDVDTETPSSGMRDTHNVKQWWKMQLLSDYFPVQLLTSRYTTLKYLSMFPQLLDLNRNKLCSNIVSYLQYMPLKCRTGVFFHCGIISFT